MNSKIVFDKPFGTLYYDETFPYVMYKAHSYMTSQQFREMLQVQLEVYRDKKSLHPQFFVIGDTRLQGVIAPKDQEWLHDYWNVEMYKAGLREIAFIVPESIFGTISMKNYTETTQTQEKYSITTPMFTSLESAKEWLETRREE